MPIKFDLELPQVRVECAGDIEVVSYLVDENTHGVAWVSLGQGVPHIPGETLVPRDCDFRLFQGVLLGFVDPRSIDTVMKLLQQAKRSLERYEVSRKDENECQGEDKNQRENEKE